MTQYGIDTSLIQGDVSRFNEIVANLDSNNIQNQTGAKAELSAIRRAQDEGLIVELLDPSDVDGIRTPDFRFNGELVDMKSTSNTARGIKDAIADVSNQIQRSGLGEKGEAIVELRGDVDTFGDLDRQVRRSFNASRGAGLHTVTIYDEAGNLLGRWTRADGQVVRRT